MPLDDEQINTDSELTGDQPISTNEPAAQVPAGSVSSSSKNFDGTISARKVAHKVFHFAPHGSGSDSVAKGLAAFPWGRVEQEGESEKLLTGVVAGIAAIQQALVNGGVKDEELQKVFEGSFAKADLSLKGRSQIVLHSLILLAEKRGQRHLAEELLEAEKLMAEEPELLKSVENRVTGEMKVAMRDVKKEEESEGTPVVAASVTVVQEKKPEEQSQEQVEDLDDGDDDEATVVPPGPEEPKIEEEVVAPDSQSIPTQSPAAVPLAGPHRGKGTRAGRKEERAKQARTKQKADKQSRKQQTQGTSSSGDQVVEQSVQGHAGGAAGNEQSTPQGTGTTVGAGIEVNAQSVGQPESGGASRTSETAEVAKVGIGVKLEDMGSGTSQVPGTQGSLAQQGAPQAPGVAAAQTETKIPEAIAFESGEAGQGIQPAGQPLNKPGPRSAPPVAGTQAPIPTSQSPLQGNTEVQGREQSQQKQKSASAPSAPLQVPKPQPKSSQVSRAKTGTEFTDPRKQDISFDVESEISVQQKAGSSSVPVDSITQQQQQAEATPPNADNKSSGSQQPEHRPLSQAENAPKAQQASSRKPVSHTPTDTATSPPGINNALGNRALDSAGPAAGQQEDNLPVTSPAEENLEQQPSVPESSAEEYNQADAAQGPVQLPRVDGVGGGLASPNSVSSDSYTQTPEQRAQVEQQKRISEQKDREFAERSRQRDERVAAGTKPPLGPPHTEGSAPAPEGTPEPGKQEPEAKGSPTDRKSYMDHAREIKKTLEEAKGNPRKAVANLAEKYLHAGSKLGTLLWLIWFILAVVTSWPFLFTGLPALAILNLLLVSPKLVYRITEWILDLVGVGEALQVADAIGLGKVKITVKGWQKASIIVLDAIIIGALILITSAIYCNAPAPIGGIGTSECSGLSFWNALW